jgi:hypothetical protein
VELSEAAKQYVIAVVQGADIATAMAALHEQTKGARKEQVDQAIDYWYKKVHRVLKRKNR